MPATCFSTARPETTSSEAMAAFERGVLVEDAAWHWARPGDAPPSIVLGYTFWQNKLGGDAAIVGTTAFIDRRPVTIAGVVDGSPAESAGLAAGGVARVGQVQLIQPVITLGWSALLLGEAVSGLTMTAAALVLVCVLLTQRTRAASGPPQPVARRSARS